jgi:Flp pilus assembly protein TadG
MIRFLRKLWKDCRGNALVITAAALPLLIGSAGLATDTIQWTVWKRQLQRAADSAALAGVHGLVAGQTPVASCSSGPVNRDLTLNNHVLLGNGNTNCSAQNPVNWSGTSDSNAVKVTLSVQKRLGFSSLFLSSTPTITAAATATVVATGRYCVISLEPTNATGLTYQGNAGVNMGCGMKTNSRGTCATNGGGSAHVTASPIAAVGGICNSQGVFGSDTVMQPYSAPQPDPYASVNPPAPTDYPAQACPNFRVNSNTTQTTLTSGTDYRAMTGSGMSNYYCMGSMTLNGTVTLPSGVYIIDGGSLSIGSQANVSCNSCTFVLTNRSSSSSATIGTVNMNGGATIHLVDSQSGTYAGMLFYQDRRATLASGAGQSSLINGNSSSSFQGAFYFPSTSVTFNGTSGMQTNCMQLVGRQVTFSGNTSISNSCPSGGPETTYDATTIRLVA